MAPTISKTTATKGRLKSQMLLPPTQSNQGVSIEYSVHTLPPSFKRELSSVFPSQAITRVSNILLIATMQKPCIDLLAYGEREDMEKDRLLEAFFRWSTLVRNAILRRASDVWVDATDPASGVARWGPRGSIYPDVDGFSRILRYNTFDAGGCAIVRHPKWGSACYPASLFTNAPFDVVRNTLEEVSGALTS